MTGQFENLVIEISAATHRGLVRDRNEDAVSVNREMLAGRREAKIEFLREGPDHLLMIADGMGGHARGEIASSRALEFIHNHETPFDVLEWQRLIREANNELYDFMLKRPETIGMGTTLVGVAIRAEGVMCFNVGDSRAYLHRSGTLNLMSHDDVPDVKGEIRKRSHQITQSLGGRSARTQVFPHVRTHPALRYGETILLCSDGLTDMISEERLEEHLSKQNDPSECVEYLLNEALDQGGVDNISIVIARMR
ncbi:protein phosphatase 2C domain-containing protein [Rhizobium sp. MC63]|uniref:Protein phosphatase 2C domain-containing protein n=1 Tax=Rhizobium mulingense TaxID=3031128 RepID=A0ACC6N2R8_9HYPH|nr:MULTISPECIES: protein phosphatase 2C domain-containing protein [unclassified Rhizobium]MDF0695623.1 protein phosphatase 2C domain-containing protein [Rhizobium sp. MC63]MEA3519241.1 protein phosphatase 2C domain-containing protein [Rhizobium sp. MJ31]